MKKLFFRAFCWTFNFEMEFFHLYIHQSSGLKVYQRDRRDNPHHRYVGIRYVLRQQ